MKHFFTTITLLALIIFTDSSVSAQVFLNEDFTTPNSIPAGWTALTPQGAKHGDGWIIANTSTYSKENYFTPSRNGNFAAVSDDSCGCSNDGALLKTQSLNLKGASSAYISLQSYFLGGYIVSNPGIQEVAKIVFSSDGGNTWPTSIAIPADSTGTWETMYYDISGLAGDTNVVIGFLYNDSSQVMFGWAIDSISIFVPDTEDLSINSPTPVTSPTPIVGAYKNYFTTGSAVTIGFSIFNNSAATVTSFIASYTVDGGMPITETFSGFTIPPFGNLYSLSFTTQYTVPSLGTHNVQIVVNINGDVNLSNDTAHTTIIGTSFMPYHNMVFEEATGTWCGWCPRGIVFMDSIHNAYPGNPSIIIVHNNDPMAITAYNNGEVSTMAGFLDGHTSFPNVLVDRKELVDPLYAFYGYAYHINDFGFATVSATTTYTDSSRVSTVNVSVTPAIELTHVIRLACVYTEDGVHGTASDYAQNNYYSYQVENEPLAGAGFNWQIETDPVPATSMFYNFVARTILGGYSGQASSLPIPMAEGSIHNYTFNYTIDPSFVEQNMKIIVLLIDATTNTILNSTSPISVTGINDVKSNVQTLSLYPNPASNQLNILFNLGKPQSAVLQITDMMGRVVYSMPYNNLAPTNQEVQLPIDNLAAGVYLFSIKTETGIVSRKFIKD